MKVCDECGTKIGSSHMMIKVFRNGREELVCIDCMKKVMKLDDKSINEKPHSQGPVPRKE